MLTLVLTLYTIISIIIGIIDSVLLILVEKEIVEDDSCGILGIHNWIFLPSWIVIGIGYGIFKTTRKAKH